MSQVNLFISKLFENVGSLVFEEADEEEKHRFTITGVMSALGEKLEFNQVRKNDSDEEEKHRFTITGVMSALGEKLEFNQVGKVTQTRKRNTGSPSQGS